MASKEKSPAFQFYPKDWISDINVISMSPAQRGIYIQLLALMWLRDDCALPNVMPVLKTLSNGEEKDIEVVLNCFEKSEGKIFSKRLNKENKKQKEFSKEQSERAKSRWQKGKQKDATASIRHSHSPASIRECSSISIASSFSSSNNSFNKELYAGIIPESLKLIEGFEEVWLKWCEYMVTAFPQKKYLSANAEAHLRELVKSVYPVEMINRALKNANGYMNPLTEKDILEFERGNKKVKSLSQDLSDEELSRKYAV